MRILFTDRDTGRKGAIVVNTITDLDRMAPLFGASRMVFGKKEGFWHREGALRRVASGNFALNDVGRAALQLLYISDRFVDCMVDETPHQAKKGA